MRNDPLNAIDPAGTDIVLLYTDPFFEISGLVQARHQGFLIGDDQSGWTYRSLEGAERQGDFSGPANYAPTERFKTLDEAMASGTVQTRYTEAHRRATSDEVDAQMNEAADAFQERNDTYNLLECNCGDFAHSAASIADPAYPNTPNPTDTLSYVRGAPGWRRENVETGSRLPRPPRRGRDAE